MKIFVKIKYTLIIEMIQLLKFVDLRTNFKIIFYYNLLIDISNILKYKIV